MSQRPALRQTQRRPAKRWRSIGLPSANLQFTRGWRPAPKIGPSKRSNPLGWVRKQFAMSRRRASLHICPIQESHPEAAAHRLCSALPAQVPARFAGWRSPGPAFHHPGSSALPDRGADQRLDTSRAFPGSPERSRSDLDPAAARRPGSEAPVAAQEQPGQGGQLPHQRIPGAHRLS